ncbi:MAG: hypothetical protein LBR30_02980 [Clostridioides sp.]|jgi:hypothetical protein|nr:hypothetical protein [Clostridioides sp.]
MSREGNSIIKNYKVSLIILLSLIIFAVCNVLQKFLNLEYMLSIGWISLLLINLYALFEAIKIKRGKDVIK